MVVWTADKAGAKAPLFARQIQSGIDGIVAGTHGSGSARGPRAEGSVQRRLGVGLDGAIEAVGASQAQVGGDIDVAPLAAMLDPGIVGLERTGAQTGFGAVDLVRCLGDDVDCT